MKKPTRFLQKIIPDSLHASFDIALNQRNYRQFSLILLTTMVSIVMGPMLMIAGLGYSNYKDLLQKEEQAQVEWQLEGSIRAIEQMVDSLRSVVQFISRVDRFSELENNDELRKLFERLVREYPYFADIGVINQAGIQQAYFGEYNLSGADYSKEEWFKEVVKRGVYISRVYMGYRQVPHFTVADSSHDPMTNQLWVLRTTIDANSLQQFVNTIKTNATDDLFIIDDSGVLQTSSSFYGKTLTPLKFDKKVGVSHDVNSDGENVFHAVGKIAKTPWNLVIVTKRYIHHGDWEIFQRKLFVIVFICMLISLVVISILVALITGVIRMSDERQLAMIKEAEHTDKLASIGRLAAGVGHEINNPLAIIDQKTGLIEDLMLMSPDFEYKETMNSSLKVINQSVERCKVITHRLLGFARRTDIRSELLQINDILKEVLLFLDNSMMYNRIRVDLQLSENLPALYSDQIQLQQIFLNIINNAIDAIGKDGVITILTNVIAGDLRIVIQDDGPGIDEQILPHIFEPFFTTKETGKGTGLGLSITYGLVKKLGGDITVRSHVGQGTAFTITIPKRNEKDDAQQ